MPKDNKTRVHDYLLHHFNMMIAFQSLLRTNPEFERRIEATQQKCIKMIRDLDLVDFDTLKEEFKTFAKEELQEIRKQCDEKIVEMLTVYYSMLNTPGNEEFMSNISTRTKKGYLSSELKNILYFGISPILMLKTYNTATQLNMFAFNANKELAFLYHERDLGDAQKEMTDRINENGHLLQFDLPNEEVLKFLQSHGSFIRRLDLSAKEPSCDSILERFSAEEIQVIINCCPNLEVLASQKIHDKLLNLSFSHLKNLKQFNVRLREFTKSQLENLPTSLEYLNLKGTDLSDITPKCFARFPHLTRLNLLQVTTFTPEQQKEIGQLMASHEGFVYFNGDWSNQKLFSIDELKAMNLGIDLDSKDSDNNTEIHLAAANGNLYKLKDILNTLRQKFSESPSIITSILNLLNKKQETPVMCAAGNLHDNCVDFLISAGSRATNDFNNAYKNRADTAAQELPPNPDPDTVIPPPKEVSIYKMLKRSTTELLYHACKHEFDWRVKELVKFDLDSIDAAFLNDKTEEINYVMVKNKLTEVITEETALYIACFYDHAEIVKFLLAQGADANIKAKNGWSCLFVAAKKGFIEIVRMLIANNANVHYKNKNDMTALNISAYGGHEEIVNMLLEKRVDPNVADKMGAAPLHAAVQSKKLNIVKLLVEYGADINQVTRTGISILYVAAYSGQFDIVEYLTDNRDQQGKLLHPLVGRHNPQQLRKEQLKSVDIDAMNNEGLTAITVAAFNGHLNIVERLLELRADMYKSDKKCVNPLYAAAQNGHIDVARCLLNSRCELKPIGNKNTPFHAVAIENNTDILELLLEKFTNKDIDAKNIDGVTALYMACEKGHLKVLELLIAAGANVNTPNKHTVSPLNIASQNGHTEVVELLLANGADVNSQTEDGPTPLFIASNNGHTKICKLLLAYKAEVDTRTKEKETALFVAGYFGHAEIVEELIKHKAQVNLVDKDNRTALWWASKAGREPVVKLLMDAGADVNITDKWHVTPMMVAAQHERNGVCELLKTAKSQATLCSTCLTNTRCILFLPCKHFVSCGDCGTKLGESGGPCPSCFTPIKESIRVYT